MNDDAPALWCVFCRGGLTVTEASARCGTCRAAFSLERNERGCVVVVRVVDCGAGTDCCQQRASDPNQPPTCR